MSQINLYHLRVSIYLGNTRINFPVCINCNKKRDSRWLSSLSTHKKDTTPYTFTGTSTNTKKPFVNDKGVRVCWFPELKNYRDCDWRERGNRTADAVKRGTRECGGFMNWEWIDEHHSKYRCNPKPEVAYTGCTWKCVVEPCSDDMLPKGCRWVGR